MLVSIVVDNVVDVVWLSMLNANLNQPFDSHNSPHKPHFDKLSVPLRDRPSRPAILHTSTSGTTSSTTLTTLSTTFSPIPTTYSTTSSDNPDNLFRQLTHLRICYGGQATLTTLSDNPDNPFDNPSNLFLQPFPYLKFLSNEQ
jgi:hypothetical protein